MVDRFNQEKFINTTLSQVEKNLNRFIFETNFSNVNSLYLRNEISKYKKKNIRRNKSQNDINSLYQNINHRILPILNRKRDPSARHKNSTIFNPKIINKNIISGKQDINKIFVKDPLKSELRQINYIKKFLKYSNENLNQKLYHTQLLDKYKNTIIRNKDMKKGLYDLINKGYIPKGADVTPSLNKEGNPFSITSKDIFYKYKKSKEKDEIENSSLNRMKYTPEYNMNVFYKTYQPLYKKIELNKNNSCSNVNSKREIKFNKNVFITSEEKKFNKNNSDIINNILVKKADSQNDYFISKNIKFSNNLFNKLKPYPFNNYNKYITDEKETFYEYIKNINLEEDNKILKFKDYKLIKNNEFDEFKKKNNKKWEIIKDIINNFSIILSKLNYNYAEADSNKIIKLIDYYNDDIKYIKYKDLLFCLTEKDLKVKELDFESEKYFYDKIKEIFVIKIQRMVRRMFAIIKYNYLKLLNIYSIIIQKNFRCYFHRKKAKQIKYNYKLLIHNKYIEILNDFKKNWDNNKERLRIEIHINSLSYDRDNNCNIDKYILKESLQLNRLIRLIDSNLEIIYIFPYNVPEEVLAYYYSNLEKVGIENIKKRVHFLVPEACEYLPNNFSLSKLLYLSPKTLNQIKILTRNKFTYIIPGVVGPIEEYLSYNLEIPILMSNLNKINLMFNKSGIKNILEMNEIPFPISAWDIKESEEFYSSLSHLIATYPTIKIWIMKTNNDINGKTIAYLDTGKNEFINQLKKEKKMNINFTTKIFQEKLYYQIKNIIAKEIVFSYPNFYHNWNEYFQMFLKNSGVIEACPTSDLDGIMGRPCIPLLIEPNGKIKILPTFEKINVEYFKNAINTSPQNNIDNDILNKLANKLGIFLYHQDIIGYVTIECITFHDGKKVLYWCTDLIYGLTQTISDIQYGYFFFIQGNLYVNNITEKIYNITNNKNNNNNEDNFDSNNQSNINSNIINEINYNQILSKVMIFSIPFISTEIIKNTKLKHLLRDIKYDNIEFIIEKKEGIILNLCDGLECGIFGIVGIINNEGYERINPNYKLWKLIDRSMNIIKNLEHKLNINTLMSSVSKQIFGSSERIDTIGLHLIFSKIKKVLKQKENEVIKEENRKKKISNEAYL